LGASIKRVPTCVLSQSKRQRKSTVLVFDQAHHRRTILFGFGWREIHSSERRKPSEVSVRLKMALSYMADRHAPDPKPRGPSLQKLDQRVLDSIRGVCTVWLSIRICIPRSAMKTLCISSTRTKVPTRSPTLHTDNAMTEPVYDAHRTTLVTLSDI